VSNLKKRNFEILKDRISGLTTAKTASKHGLSGKSISNIVKRQLEKIAEHDHEFQRRLGSLHQTPEESENNAKTLASKFVTLQKSEDYYKKQEILKDKEIEKLKIELNSMRKVNKSLSEKHQALERSIRNGTRIDYAMEYEKVKSNLNKYRG
jgi:uncharacterized protein YdiU (UPF0061 family)